jgi:hypothetical protein
LMRPCVSCISSVSITIATLHIGSLSMHGRGWDKGLTDIHRIIILSTFSDFLWWAFTCNMNNFRLCA